MKVLIPLDDVAHALGFACMVPREALAFITSLRELAQRLTDQDDLGREATIEIRDAARVALGRHGIERYPAPRRSLSILQGAEGAKPSIVLGSIHATHADVLSFDGIDESDVGGVRTVVGDFTHTPTGARLLICVAAIPNEVKVAEPTVDGPVDEGDWGFLGRFFKCR